MKRMSIAEQTLKKQIDQFNAKREVLFRERNSLSDRISELFSSINDMEAEMRRLEKVRKVMSIKNRL